jgi:hypothetical protein
MGNTTKLTLVAAAAITAAALAATSATGRTGATVIRFTVPVSAVRSHGIDVPPKGSSAGDGFQESYVLAAAGKLRRQDAIGISTFGRATFLGTITLKNGQIVYAGTTNNQDDTAYAILGGTGAYETARGTVTTHTLPQGRVEITIATID